MAASIVAASTLAAQAGTVNFSDNFTPAPSPLWNNYSGNWTASGGQYYAQVPNNAPPAISALPFDLSNFTLTTTVNQLGDGGIFLRSNGTNTGPSVLLNLGGNGYGQGMRGGNAGSSLYFCTTALGCNVGEVNNVFVPGNTYTVRVTAVGGTYSVFLNGATNPVDVFTDNSDPTHGMVGLYDDQPNTTTGNGFGPPTTYSNFSLSGTLYGSTTAPEPATWALFAAGLGGLAGFARRRARA